MLGWSLDSLLEGNAFGDDNLQMPKGTTKHYLNLVWLSKCWKEIPFEAYTGKPFSKALTLVSTNPQYDKRLFIELQVQYIKIPSSEHVENM